MARRRKQPAGTPPEPPAPQPHSAPAAAPAHPRAMFLMAAAVLACLAVVGLVPRDVRDADVFWHLATGRELHQLGPFLRTDPFSYTSANIAWVNHEWLFQWMLWPLFRAVGPTGLGLITGLGYAMAVALPAWWTWRRGMAWAPTAFAAGTAMLLIVPFAQSRPTMVTLAASGLVAILADTARTQWTHRLHAMTRTRAEAAGESVGNRARAALSKMPWPWLAALGAVMLAWANTHATFPLGLVIAFILLCPAVGRVVPGPPLVQAGGVVGALAVVTLVNPYGWGVWWVPMRVAGSTLFTAANQEWRPPDTSREFWPVAVALPMVLLGCIAARRSNPRSIMLALLFSAAALRSRRMLPWLGVVGLPVIAAGWAWLLARIPAHWRTNPATALGGVLACAVAALGWTLSIAAPPVGLVQTPSGLLAQAGMFPVANAALLPSIAPGGRVFNDYNHGGYLHLAAGPTWKVGMDGRNDLHGEAATLRYNRIATGAMDPLRALDEDQVTAVLASGAMMGLPGGIVARLVASPAWCAVGVDDAGILFVRRSSVDKAVLAPMELKLVRPTETFAAMLDRAQRSGAVAALAAETAQLARRTPGRLSLTWAARAAHAAGNTAEAKAYLLSATAFYGADDPLVAFATRELKGI